MEYPGAEIKGKIFLSCKKERHYSRELMLDQHALVHVYSGTLTIAYASQTHTYQPGNTIIIPRNQLGRLTKLPADGGPFKSVSILFPEQLLRKFYAQQQAGASLSRWEGHLALHPHPLLESLFNSLLPYFGMQDELAPDLTEIKILESLTVLNIVDPQVQRILGSFREPGKLDLADFMDAHFMYNLPLEKFGYLTGRSLTTFKKDFKQVFKTTPGKWLTQKRLELAHFMLLQQRRRPVDVYVEAGFENLSHFSYAFKKHFGYPPNSLL